LCRELDAQIERCRKIWRSAPNELMREAVVALIPPMRRTKPSSIAISTERLSFSIQAIAQSRNSALRNGKSVLITR
jgi:hypothetical protein